ncbi:MAG TPA: MMPL family transporter [Thermoanaerobaculia bacterium]
MRLIRASLRHPRLAIVLVLAVTGLAAAGLPRLELRTDGHALVPPGDPAIVADAEIRGRFRLRDPIVVLVQTSHPGGIFNLETLTRVRKLSDAFAALPGVGPENVASLATERRDRVYPGTLTFRPFLDPLPDTPELMETLRGDVEAPGLLRGTLVSYDGKAATILVGVPSGPGGTGDRIAFYRQVRSLADSMEGGRDRIDVVGAPVAEALLGTHLLADLAVLLPLSLAVVALIVWLGCRRVWGVLLALSNAGACIVATFGLMGWLGSPVYLTTAMLPVVLTTVAVADEIHVFWQHQRALAAASGESPAELVARTLGRLAAPIVFTTVTTAVGFLSFLSSPIQPVRAFGLFAGIGVLFCLAWSFLVTPAALLLLGPERLRRPAMATRPGGDRISQVLALGLRRPGWTLAALAGLTLILGAGVARLQVQDSWIDGFAPGSDFYQATQRANRHLHGTHTLLVHLDFDRPAPEGVPAFQSPAVLDAVGRLEGFLRGRPYVGGVLGPNSHLSAVTYLWLARQEEMRAIPRHPDRVKTAWERFDMGRGEHRRREIVDDDLRRGVVTVFLKDANYRDTAALMDDIRAFSAKYLAPLGGRIGFAGDVAVSQAMIPAIVRTQVSSVLWALVGSFAAVWIASRSFRTAGLAILPVSVAVLWVFGVMGWSGIPLGVATSMFCSISLGIGVDYAIHLLDRMRPMSGQGSGETALQAVQEVGPAIVTDTAAIALGFGLLAISQVPSNARFGGLVAVALLASCVLTLAGLGALLARRSE